MVELVKLVEDQPMSLLKARTNLVELEIHSDQTLEELTRAWTTLSQALLVNMVEVVSISALSRNQMFPVNNQLDLPKDQLVVELSNNQQL